MHLTEIPKIRQSKFKYNKDSRTKNVSSPSRNNSTQNSSLRSKHIGKPNVRKIYRKVRSISQSFDESENPKEVIPLEEKGKKEFDSLANDSEDEVQESARMKTMKKYTKNYSHCLNISCTPNG